MAEEAQDPGLAAEQNSSALNALAGFTSPNFGGAYKPSEEIVDMVSNKFSSEETTATETTTKETTATDTETTSTTETTEETTSTDSGKEEEELSIDSPFFGGKKVIEVKKEEKKDELKVENLEELNTQLKEKFGIEDISSLSEQISTWKEKEKSLGEISEKLTNAEKLFESMPSDLYQLVQLHVSGEDWKKGLANPSLNFEKRIEDYKDKELIDVLYPGQVTDEDWEEYHDEDGDGRVKKMVGVLLDQAKSRFTETKKQRDEMAKAAIENAKKEQERYERSVEISSKKLSSQIEGIDSNYIKSIEDQLKTPGGIAELFFDKDGVLKEDAALAFAMAKDGYTLLDQYKKVIQKQTEIGRAHV